MVSGITLYHAVVLTVGGTLIGRQIFLYFDEEGTNKNKAKLNRAYNRIKDKKNKNIAVFLNDKSGEYCRFAHCKINEDNKELIKECFTSHEWSKVFGICDTLNPTDRFEYVIDNTGITIFYK